MLNMLDEPRHWPPAARALGLEALLDDPRFAEPADRAANHEALHEIFVERIGSLLLADVVASLSAEDTLFSTLASPLEVIDDPQVIANGYFAQHPDDPRARLATAPMQFDDQTVEVRRGAPALGQHTDEVLGALGYDADELEALRTAGVI
jgi:crotonobetainyl-CoA:carnitine CoA-transferase CaiB-like acyl-CoA transferase